MTKAYKPMAAGTRIGHVHLRVADIDRALGFYCGALAMFNAAIDLKALLAFR